MKIATLVIVQVVMYDTQEQISEASGTSSGFVVPRVGEFISTSYDSKSTSFEVVGVRHIYEESYRNTTIIYVKHCDPFYGFEDEE